MSPSLGLLRRDLLAALLGIPFVAGCQSGNNTPSFSGKIAGEIVGADRNRGHQIRDRTFSSHPVDRWQETDIVIVGGGVAGLSTAWQLDRLGCSNLVILELESQIGGTSRFGERGGFKFPWGAHYLPVPQVENTNLIELLTEMGVVVGTDERGHPIVGEEFLCREPEERVFFDGQWHEDLWFPHGLTENDRNQFQQFNQRVNEWVDWRDAAGKRAFSIPLDESSRDPRPLQLDQISMASWLQSENITSERVRWLVDYACRDDYGLTLDHVSAWAGLFYFASRVPEAGAAAQKLISWPEGNGRLVTHLSSKLTSRIQSGCGVFHIRNSTGPEKKSPTVEVLAVDQNGETIGYRAQRVIFAAPQFLAAHVIDGYRAARGESVSEFGYGSWLVANLFLRDRPREASFPLCWDNVIYGSQSLGYVVSTHQSGHDWGPTVLTWYFPNCNPDPVAARRQLEQLTWQECAELALTDLEVAHPDIRGLVERIDVMRWGHAMVLPRPGFLFGSARSKCAEPLGGIHFAHSDLSGVALFEEAFHQGLRAAAEVHKHVQPRDETL